MFHSHRGFQNPRGGLGGRGRGRGWYTRGASTRQPRSQPPLPTPETSQKRLQIVRTEQVSRLVEDTRDSKLKNRQYVASYNWLGKEDATILVPGLPPTWCPPVVPPQLNEDKGDYYRDQNAARFPVYPIDPAVRAIFELNPEYASSEVDVFACASILGSLMSFVKDKENRTFRLGVERIGKTVFLVRKTNQPKEVIDGVRGYGHTFPEAYTSWDESVRNSASNQRIVSYDFGGLKCLVRSECDGFDPAKVLNEEHQPQDSAEDAHGNLNLSNQSEDSLHPRNLNIQKKSLNIIRAGRTIPQSSIFDIKTRSVEGKENYNMQVLLPRYWLNQTPNIVLGWHTKGTFHDTDIEIKDVRDLVKTWEEENASTIAGLRSLLHILIEFSNQPGQSRFEVRRTEDGPLEFWSEVMGWSALPRESKARWRGESVDTYIDQDEEGENAGNANGHHHTHLHHGELDEHEDNSSNSEDETPDYLKF